MLILTAPVALCLFLMASTAGARQLAYVSNSRSDSVSAIDTSTQAVIATLTVGKNPAGLAVSGTGETLYVVDSGGLGEQGTVDVIDTATHTLSRTIAVGTNPEAIALSSDGTVAYVTNVNSRSVSVIDATSVRIATTIPVGRSPIEVALAPDGSSIYVTDLDANTLSIIDTRTHAVERVTAVPSRPVAIAFSPAGDLAYVTSSGPESTGPLPQPGSLTVIHTSDGTLEDTIPLGVFPAGIAVSPRGDFVYVANRDSDEVLVVNMLARKTVGSIPVQGGPLKIALTNDGALAYVTQTFANSVAVIDTTTNRIRTTIPVGQFPYGIVIAAAPTPPQHPCTGDCNGDASVTIDELVVCVDILLGQQPLSACPACDPHPERGAELGVPQLITAVNNSLVGCP